MNQLNQRVATVIGLLDRCLSELKILAQHPQLDESDIQTVKHHAEDCIGLGNRVLEILNDRAYAAKVSATGMAGQGCDSL
jgi:hypothetical protein